ncbi:hypothetical protein NC652_030893 [Populus alba x Populus x berolinensis]|nr:hypothetical protein NC652_030893 [Populus alba x Populus x berolinensis]
MLCGDIVSWNSLITGYACRGGFTMVKDLIIDLVMENVIPDTVSMIRLVSAAAETGAPDQGRRAHGKALQLFYEMKEDASPDNVTFVSVLSACSHSGLEIKGLKFSVL